MFAGIPALGYLEYRQIVNRARQTVRNPGRALLYLVALGYFAAITFARANGHRAISMPAVPEPYASVVMFTYVALLGVLSYGAASGIIGAFSSTADARFLSGSLIPERTVVVWLQLRRCAGSIVRMLFTIVLYALIFSSSGTAAGISFATLGGTLLASALAVPVLRFRVVSGAAFAQTCAALLATAGIAPMLILLSSLLSPTPISSALERVGAGSAFNQLFNGNPVALGSLYVAGMMLIALAYICGGGLYPELYAASLKALEFRERQRRGASAALNPEYAYELRASRGRRVTMLDAMRGPWTIAWKELVGFQRSPSMRRTFWFGVLASTGAGALFGTVAARSGDPLGDSLTIASIAANMITIFIAMGSAIGLAADLRKPLWWMGPDPLWVRLFAWIGGTSWRMALCICAGVAAWGIAMHLSIVIFAGIPLAIVAVLHLRAVGLVLYSLFPSTIDQRGPLAMIRVLLTYLLAAPPAIAGMIAGLAFHTLAGGVVTALAVSLAETTGLIAFASTRIEQRGVAVAQAEAM